MKRAEKKPPMPSACVRFKRSVRESIDGRTRIPPWTRESNSRPSTGNFETSAEAVISPVASIAKETFDLSIKNSRKIVNSRTNHILRALGE